MASKKGYVIACAVGSGVYVDGVEHIERDDSCIPWVFEDDEEAARAAEADGIKLIYGMQGVPDGVYVDSVENRQKLLAATHNGDVHKTCSFSHAPAKSKPRVDSWKYKVLRFFMNRCRVAHEVIPIEGNILYVLIPHDTNSLRPVIESLQRDYNVYVQMDSANDSTLLAVMEKWEHDPAELAIKHQAFRSNIY